MNTGHLEKVCKQFHFFHNPLPRSTELRQHGHTNGNERTDSTTRKSAEITKFGKRANKYESNDEEPAPQNTLSRLEYTVQGKEVLWEEKKASVHSPWSCTLAITSWNPSKLLKYLGLKHPQARCFPNGFSISLKQSVGTQTPQQNQQGGGPQGIA